MGRSSSLTMATQRCYQVVWSGRNGGSTIRTRTVQALTAVTARRKAGAPSDAAVHETACAAGLEGVKKRGKRCRWLAGSVAPRTPAEHTAASMGTHIYEIKCLRYEPTEQRHPKGWRYAIGSYSSRVELVKALRFPGATAIIRGE